MPNLKPHPRLCIDTRSRANTPQGVIAEEIVNFVTSADPDTDGVETVLLSHPSQKFDTATLPRFDTRRRVGNSPLYRFWEKNFIRNAELKLFHRFRPLDELNALSAASTLTTVCPPRSRKKISASLGKDLNQQFVVPSQSDRDLLIKDGGVSDESISVVYPSIRKAVRDAYFKACPQPSIVLFITGDKSEGLDYPRMSKVIGERFPNLTRKFISLNDKHLIAPEIWLRLLEKTRTCFYLSARRCDWPTLALESYFWGIPTIFQDRHPVLSELIPNTKLELSKYLIDEITANEISEDFAIARKKLESAGCFDPERMAKQFQMRQLELVKDETHLTI